MARDPYWSSVSLLLHCDGADTSTTFTDSSPAARTATRLGVSAISTTQSKFGGASLWLDGTTNQITFADNAAFNFGAGDVTIEGWFYWTSKTNQQILFSKNPSGYSQLSIVKNATHGLYIEGLLDTDANFGSTPSANDTVTTGVWYHLAVVRYDNVYTLYLNGVSKSTITQAGTLKTNTAAFVIGSRDPGTFPFSGYVDDFRVTKGHARYITAFTAPTEAFTETPIFITENMSRPALRIKSSNRPFHHIGI